MRAAHDYAETLGIAVTAAIVDEAAAPIAIGRMDKAEPRTAELAFDKAYTAAPFTSRPPNWCRKRASHGCAAWSFHTVAGSYLEPEPIIDGVTIGVASANPPEQDALCCRAALAVFGSGGHRHSGLGVRRQFHERTVNQNPPFAFPCSKASGVNVAIHRAQFRSRHALPRYVGCHRARASQTGQRQTVCCREINSSARM